MLALDVPSGVDADRGAVPGVTVRAALTLQFIVAHRGLYSGDALDHCGQKVLAPLLLPAAAWQGVVPAEHWTQVRLRALLPPRRANPQGRIRARAVRRRQPWQRRCHRDGRSRLARGWAVEPGHPPRRRSTAGPVARGHDPCTGRRRCAALLDKAKVVAIGPGLGQDEWARALFARVLASNKPLVVDADALNLLAQDPRALPDAILTPHPGEAARLLGCSTAEIQADRYTCAHMLAERFHAVVVLKGAGSIVAAPGQTPRLIAAGNPGMAVGGMGDLLTGIIASLRGALRPSMPRPRALLHAGGRCCRRWRARPASY